MGLNFSQFDKLPPNGLLYFALIGQLIRFGTNSQELSCGVSIGLPPLRKIPFQALRVSPILLLRLLHLGLEVRAVQLGNDALLAMLNELPIDQPACCVQDFYPVRGLQRGLFEGEDRAVVVERELLNRGEAALPHLQLLLVEVQILLVLGELLPQDLLKDIALRSLLLPEGLQTLPLLLKLLLGELDEALAR